MNRLSRVIIKVFPVKLQILRVRCGGLNLCVLPCNFLSNLR